MIELDRVKDIQRHHIELQEIFVPMSNGLASRSVESSQKQSLVYIEEQNRHSLLFFGPAGH